jgi:signal transduction histidine kinase
MGSWGFLDLLDKEDHLSWLPTIFDIVQTTANLIGAAEERIHSEETLRLSETRNRIMMGAMPDLLIRVDLEGHILNYNANEKHPLYLASNLITGKTLYELWPGDVVANILGYENRQAFVKANWVESFQLFGQDNIYEARLHPITAKEALIIVRDVTEQARLNQMKSDFINRASHELRTPITAAIMMTELIQQGGEKDELDEYWRTLTSELNRQKNLINQLLTAGRLESGTVHMDAIPMDLLPVLEESIQSVSPIARKRNISLNFAAGQETIRALGDKTGLQQVFINLLGNAVKFSPEGKSVDIAAGLSGKEAVVTITDHGLGIPPDALPHLFERFYRARNVTLAEIPGSGIGLYIVKSIIKELGGNISVESQVNRGTTFTVRLRLAGDNS